MGGARVIFMYHFNQKGTKQNYNRLLGRHLSECLSYQILSLLSESRNP